MTELQFVKKALKNRARIRWLVRALKLSRYKNMPGLFSRIEEKIIQTERRKGSLSKEEQYLIVENILWAKLFRRLQKWKVKKLKMNHSFNAAHIQSDNNHVSRPQDVYATVFKEKRNRFRTHPAILLPGFVPEGNEAFYLLRHSFLKYGSAYYMNFPKERYHNESLFQQIYDLISQINQPGIHSAGRRQTPFLVGTSFGCAVILNFLKWLKKHDLEQNIEIAGLVFLSPVWCMHDVCIPGRKKQPGLVARAIAPLFELDENDDEQITKAMIKARGIFSRMFKAGQKQLDATMKSRIPVLAIEEEVIDFFNIKDAKLEGYFQRYLCLRNAGVPEGRFVTNLPVLSLIADGERDVLMPESPTLLLHENPDSFNTMFPNGEMHMVRSSDPTRHVTHSDLIFNADCYRRELDPWLKKRKLG